mmetsp:Transcript_12275/g.30035  ORF Transcript_12275/g.30035 Transcript_12275/m.30035 type:complete len:253 (+) Transcript_12275:344-1102(+)
MMKGICLVDSRAKPSESAFLTSSSLHTGFPPSRYPPSHFSFLVYSVSQEKGETRTKTPPGLTMSCMSRRNLAGSGTLHSRLAAMTASNCPSLRAGMLQASPTMNLTRPRSMPGGTLAVLVSMILPSTVLWYVACPLSFIWFAALMNADEKSNPTTSWKSLASSKAEPPTAQPMSRARPLLVAEIEHCFPTSVGNCSTSLLRYLPTRGASSVSDAKWNCRYSSTARELSYTVEPLAVVLRTSPRAPPRPFMSA